jgi:acetyl esterase/lipase
MKGFTSGWVAVVLGGLSYLPAYGETPPVPATAAAPAHKVKEEYQIQKDLDYLGPGREERLDLYLPGGRNVKTLSAAVVIIHGGGMAAGNKEQAFKNNTATFLAKSGIVVASIDYRLGSGSWPENLYDCKNAIRFLRKNAERYQINPEAIAVMGRSAGGYLALMAAFTSSDKKLEPDQPYPGVSNRVCAVLDFYGPVDFLSAGAPPKTQQYMASVFNQSSPVNQEFWRSVSPLAYLSSSCPPVLILQGTADDKVSESQSAGLAEALKAKEIPHELILLEGIGHGFGFYTWRGEDLPRDLRPKVLEFLAKNTPPGTVKIPKPKKSVLTPVPAK